MDGFKKFMSEFGGAIIGAIVAILILCTGLYKLIVGIILECLEEIIFKRINMK